MLLCLRACVDATPIGRESGESSMLRLRCRYSRGVRLVGRPVLEERFMDEHSHAVGMITARVGALPLAWGVFGWLGIPGQRFPDNVWTSCGKSLHNADGFRMGKPSKIAQSRSNSISTF